MRFLFSIPLPLLLILASFGWFDTQAAPTDAYAPKEPWLMIQHLNRSQTGIRTFNSSNNDRDRSRLAEPYMAKSIYDDVKPLASVAEVASNSSYDNLSTDELNKLLGDARNDAEKNKKNLDESEKLLNDTIDQAKAANDDYEAKKGEWERLKGASDAAEELERNATRLTAEVDRLSTSVADFEGILEPYQEIVNEKFLEFEELRTIDDLLLAANAESDRLEEEVKTQKLNVTNLDNAKKAQEAVVQPIQDNFYTYDGIFKDKNCGDLAKALIPPCPNTIDHRNNYKNQLEPEKTKLQSATDAYKEAFDNLKQLRKDKTSINFKVGNLNTKKSGLPANLEQAKTDYENAKTAKSDTPEGQLLLQEEKLLLQAQNDLNKTLEAKREADSSGTPTDVNAAQAATRDAHAAYLEASQTKTTRDAAETKQRSVFEGYKKTWEGTNARVEALQKQVEKRIVKGGMNPIIIYVIVGLALLCLLVVAVGFFVYRKKRLDKQKQKKGAKPGGNSGPPLRGRFGVKISTLTKSESIAITDSAKEVKMATSKVEMEDKKVEKSYKFSELTREEQSALKDQYLNNGKENGLFTVVAENEDFLRYPDKERGFWITSRDGKVVNRGYYAANFHVRGYANEGDQEPVPSAQEPPITGPIIIREDPAKFTVNFVNDSCPSILRKDGEADDRQVAGSEAGSEYGSECGSDVGSALSQSEYEMLDDEYSDDDEDYSALPDRYPNLAHLQEEAARRRKAAEEAEEFASQHVLRRVQRRLDTCQAWVTAWYRRRAEQTHVVRVAPGRAASGQEAPVEQEADEPTQKTVTLGTGIQVDKEDEKPVAKIPDVAPPQEANKKAVEDKSKKSLKETSSQKVDVTQCPPEGKKEEAETRKDRPVVNNKPREAVPVAGRRRRSSTKNSSSNNHGEGRRRKDNNEPSDSKEKNKKNKKKWMKYAKRKGKKLFNKYEKDSTESDRGSGKSSRRTASTTFTKKMKRLAQLDDLTPDRMDELISILSYSALFGIKLTVHYEDICKILAMAEVYFEEGPTLIEVGLPVAIVSDIHGRLTTLLQILASYSKKEMLAWKFRKLLFLGDYVDRGESSCQVMILLFLLKLRHPESVFLLRGNHEDEQVCERYGFKQELLNTFGEINGPKLFQKFLDVFARMPLSAVVGGEILAMHGGIPQDLKNLAQINDPNVIPRVLYEPQMNQMAAELMWSDPGRGVKGFIPNSARGGAGFPRYFGEDVLIAECNRLGIKFVVRGHQPMITGYKFFAGMRLITVFSAVYYETLGNYGATLDIGKDGSWGIRLYVRSNLHGADDTPEARKKAFETVHDFHWSKNSHHLADQYQKGPKIPKFSIGAVGKKALKSSDPCAEEELTKFGDGVTC